MHSYKHKNANKQYVINIVIAYYHQELLLIATREPQIYF